MRVRYFGIIFMVVVVAVPIAALAYLATKRAERTAIYEVRLGNGNGWLSRSLTSWQITSAANAARSQALVRSLRKSTSRSSDANCATPSRSRISTSIESLSTIQAALSWSVIPI